MDLIPRRSFFRDFFDDLLDMPVLKGNDLMQTDIYEENNYYILEIDIPGFTKEDVNIDYNNRYLNISANKEEERKDNNKNYIRRERFKGQYKRSFYVGDISEDLIKASFENGILKVKFPKEQIDNRNKKVIDIE